MWMEATTAGKPTVGSISPKDSPSGKISCGFEASIKGAPATPPPAEIRIQLQLLLTASARASCVLPEPGRPCNSRAQPVDGGETESEVELAVEEEDENDEARLDRCRLAMQRINRRT